jgi:hypothetical protein
MMAASEKAISDVAITAIFRAQIDHDQYVVEIGIMLIYIDIEQVMLISLNHHPSYDLPQHIGHNGGKNARI